MTWGAEQTGPTEARVRAGDFYSLHNIDKEIKTDSFV